MIKLSETCLVLLRTSSFRYICSHVTFATHLTFELGANHETKGFSCELSLDSTVFLIAVGWKKHGIMSPHSPLGYLSPMEFERTKQLKAA